LSSTIRTVLAIPSLPNFLRKQARIAVRQAPRGVSKREFKLAPDSL
jgi:hypothetical protein